jgi:hypothetical protein
MTDIVYTPDKLSHHYPTDLTTKHKLPSSTKSTISTPNKAVHFTSNPSGEKKREKYLTAKYGAHQMALIRKRLKVEMWMFDQIQELQESVVIIDAE